jgi:hypothetical protein
VARTPRSGSTRRHVVHGLLLLLAGVLVACGTPVTPTAPTISSFTATPASITAGGSSTLAWTTVGATENTIRAGATVVTTSAQATGSISVTPTATTTYTLTSTNATGETTQDVTVTVTPTVPVVTTFTATPPTIAPGGTSTLDWATTGATAIEIRIGATVVTTSDQATGSFDVTPATTTTYTLVASNAVGDATQDVTVTVTPTVPGTLTLTGASVVTGSQVALTWSTTGSPTGITVLAVDNVDDANTVVVTNLAGSANSANVPIPVAARQRLRVCATFAAGPAACGQQAISGNVVTLATDYDPYALLGVTPDPPIPGTLRAVIDAAAAGSVIGFAADVTEVDVFGVDTGAYAPLPGIQDAHLILGKNVTISGPAAKVTLRGRSGWVVGDPGDAFTYRSRMLFVAPNVTVVLENLVLTGGDFIFFGGGLRNNGTTTLNQVDVVDNRSWLKGGGIWNDAGATLTIQGGSVADNQSIVTDAERGTTYLIRGSASAEIPGPGNPFGDGGFGGGIYNEAGATLTITNSAVTGNEAMVSGGGIYNNGTLTMSGTNVSGNDGSYAAYTPVGTPFALGGGVYTNGPFSFSNGQIGSNAASDIGGGLYVDAASLTTLTAVAITGNGASFSGGLHHRFCPGTQSNLTRVSVTVTGNTPDNENAQPDAAACPAAAPTTATAPTVLPGRYVAPAGVDPASLNR